MLSAGNTMLNRTHTLLSKSLSQELADVFYKRSNRKYFRLCGICMAFVVPSNVFIFSNTLKMQPPFFACRLRAKAFIDPWLIDLWITDNRM